MIAPEGRNWVSGSGLLAIIGYLAWKPVGIIAAVVFAFICFFFRDPNRKPPPNPNQILSAADGKITEIRSVTWQGQSYYQIVTFLSVFNCHINRIPFEGSVQSVTHEPGQFLAAYRKDIDEKNERNTVVLDTAIGPIKMVQITGAIARRIVCHLKVNQVVTTGERFGLIKFGSRTDVYLPQQVELAIAVGDHVKGGLTPLATLKASDPNKTDGDRPV